MKKYLCFLKKTLVLVFFLNTFNLQAAMPITDYYFSRTDGDYFASGLWSMSSHTGSSCGCFPDDNGLCSIVIPSNSAVYIGHDVICNCDITISNNALLVVTNGGNLTITGTSSLTGTGDLLIEQGGTLNIAGDFDLNGFGTAVNDGILNVYGDLTFSGNSSLCGDGIVNVAGYTVGGEPCSTIVLPVELISFEAAEKDGAVNLEWITASELNSDFFMVERSSDGINFSAIGTLPAAGNSSNTIRYSMEDPGLSEGVYYYRLIQQDKNGLSRKYTPVAVLNSGKVKTLRIFPNPVSSGSSFTIGIPEADADKMRMKIKDIAGKEIYDKVFERNNGSNVLNPGIEIAEPGIYFITVHLPGEMISSIVVVGN